MDFPSTSSTLSTAHGAHAIESEPEKKKKDETEEEYMNILESLAFLFGDQQVLKISSFA